MTPSLYGRILNLGPSSVRPARVRVSFSITNSLYYTHKFTDFVNELTIWGGWYLMRYVLRNMFLLANKCIYLQSLSILNNCGTSET